MDELDHDARILIRRACAEERRPPAVTRMRVQRAVGLAAPTAAILGSSASTAAASASTATGLAVGSAKALSGLGTIGAFGLKTWFVCGVACGVGVTATGFGVWSHRDALLDLGAPSTVASFAERREPRTVKVERTAASAASPGPELVQEQLPAREAISTPSESPSAERAQRLVDVSGSQASTRPAPTLAKEVRILTEAQGHLSSGRAQAALDSLRQDDGRFASSPLRSDLDAVRILTLCELGRVDEARSAALAFANSYPGSPHEARIRSACGASVAHPTAALPDPKTRQDATDLGRTRH